MCQKQSWRFHILCTTMWPHISQISDAMHLSVGNYCNITWRWHSWRKKRMKSGEVNEFWVQFSLGGTCADSTQWPPSVWLIGGGTDRYYMPLSDTGIQSIEKHADVLWHLDIWDIHFAKMISLRCLNKYFMIHHTCIYLNVLYDLVENKGTTFKSLFQRLQEVIYQPG